MAPFKNKNTHKKGFIVQWCFSDHDPGRFVGSLTWSDGKALSSRRILCRAAVGL